MRDEDEGGPAPEDLLDPRDALSLELDVADGQDLVDEQDVGFHVRRDREPEPRDHPGGIRAERGVDEVAELREVDDRVEATLHLPPGAAEDRAVQEHVLAAGELHVEASAELEE